MKSSILRSAALFTCIAVLPLRADDKPASPPTTKPTTRPAPKPLSDNVKKGLAYLARTQLPNGAWGQGDESAQMGNGMDKLKTSPNVADTCMSVMALSRGGSSPKAGEYQDHILKAIAFVCDQVERADSKDLYVTDLRNTRTQTKLGSYIDTFMAAQMLAEMKNQMPDAAATKRVDAALARVVKKIEDNQQNDGRFAGGGWAPVLAQGQAAKAINITVQNGGQVSEKTRASLEQVARADFNGTAGDGAAPVGTPGTGRGTFTGTPAVTAGTLTISGASSVALSGDTFVTTSPATMPAGASRATRSLGSGGDAGVELYSRASQVAGMQASSNTNSGLRQQYQVIAESPTTRPADREAATRMLTRFDANDKDLAAAQDALVDRLQDKRFVAGFGSNGGEEFLSYLNIGESLILKGGDAWEKWDKSVTENLNRIQNDDGSWSGQHCITGRTFCSAAAVMVLTIDRAPTPAAPK